MNNNSKKKGAGTIWEDNVKADVFDRYRMTGMKRTLMLLFMHPKQIEAFFGDDKELRLLSFKKLKVLGNQDIDLSKFHV